MEILNGIAVIVTLCGAAYGTVKAIWNWYRLRKRPTPFDFMKAWIEGMRKDNASIPNSELFPLYGHRSCQGHQQVDSLELSLSKAAIKQGQCEEQLFQQWLRSAR